MVQTCPVCLPPGAITWMIENGRQLELFSDGAVPADLPGGDDIVRLDMSVSVSALPEAEADVVAPSKVFPNLGKPLSF